MATIVQWPKAQFFDSNGDPLAGGKVYTYQAGTSTPLATYTDYTGLTPNTNPVILDARGEASIWTGTQSYKFVLKDSTDSLIWTVDNLQSSYQDVIDRIALSDGASLVGFIQAGTGAVARTSQSKMRERVSPLDFGAVGDGTTDDTAALQAAIDYVKHTRTAGRGVNVPITEIDLAGLNYRVSSPLTIDGSGIVIKNGRIEAIPGAAWTDTNAIIQVMGGATGATAVWQVHLRDLIIDGHRDFTTGLASANCVKWEGTQKCSAISCWAGNFKNFGFKAYNTIVEMGSGGDYTNGELKLIGCSAYEHDYSSSFATNIANYLGTAFWFQTSDFIMSECVGAVSKHGLYVENAWNYQVSSSHFWGGPIASGTLTVTKVGAEARSGVFNGNYFEGETRFIDNGIKSTLTGGLITDDIVLETSTANNTAAGFIATNLKVAHLNFITFATSGAGSWSSTIEAIVHSNWNTNGDNVANGYGVIRATEFQTGIGNGAVVYSPASLELGFKSNFTLGLKLDSTQKLLSGNFTSFATTGAERRWQVAGTTPTTASMSISRFSADANGAIVDLCKSRNTTVALDAADPAQAGDILGELRFAGQTTDGALSQGSSITSTADVTYTANRPTSLNFWTATTNAMVMRLNIDHDGLVSKYQESPATANADATLTVAQVKKAIVASTPPSAGISLTLPTGTDLDADTYFGTDMAFDLTVINLSPTYTVTLVANTDHTVVGNMVVAVSSSATFRVRKTAANTFVTYRI